MSVYDRKIFFDSVRASLFNNRLDSGQVTGMDFLLSELERKGWPDIRWSAYALATTLHETARTMQPIKEMGGASYFFRMYDIKGDRPAVATRLGNSFPGDGVKFAGRGYVQITGRANYTDWGKRLDLPLTAQPDLALEPDVAAVILLDGMEYGTFTSRRLSAYFNDTTNDAINARRIVNGVDKAELIAGYHNKFLAALEAARIAPAPEEVLVAPKSLEERVAALESDVVELKRMLTNGV